MAWLGDSWEQTLEFFLLFKRSQGLSDASLAPATFNTRRKVLKSFFGWTMSEGVITSDPMAGIKNRREGDVPRAVDEDVVRRLLALSDRTMFAGMMDYGLLVLSMDTGIRPKEALGLRSQDFDFANLTVTIPAEIAKMRVTRTLPITPVTAEVVRRLLLVRHKAWPEDAPVFCNQDGSPFCRNSWDRRLRKYSRLLGTKVRPYDLLPSFASTHSSPQSRCTERFQEPAQGRRSFP